VNEREWLSSTDPEAMLTHLGDRADKRKLRLFACACYRRVWHLIDEEPSKRAVEVGEELADGRADRQELRRVRAAARRVGAEAAARLAGGRSAGAQVARLASQLAVIMVLHAAAGGDMVTPVQAEQEAQADLLRCVFGNPFNPPPSVPASVLAWNSGTISKLAETIYQGRAFERLPVLADALEEAGLTDPIILGHCRGGGLHARGCFALDLAMGTADDSVEDTRDGDKRHTSRHEETRRGAYRRHRG
jgi:hypothetical protein